MDLINVVGLSRTIKNNKVVRDISFAQRPLEKIAIAGETGSGKTSVLRMIAGLVQPDGGALYFKGERILGPNDQLIPGRKEIAYLSQHFELRNNYWVYELLDYANELGREKASSLYEICRIDHLLNRRTDQLSGGEKQRIALARLLSTSPELLLLDEPFSNLDQIHKNVMKAVVDDVGKELMISCIMVSHDARDLLSWADTMMIMKEGEIVQQSTPVTIYRQPVNEYCAGLLGAYNIFPPGSDHPLLSAAGVDTADLFSLVRPERVMMAAHAHQGWKGQVRTMSFWGNYYLLEVEINGQLIKVQSSSAEFSIGDEIFVFVDRNDVWQFQNL